MAEFAYNNTIHSSTKMSLFRALYGYDLDLPPVLGLEPPPNELPAVTERMGSIINARKILERNWLEASAAQARYYNRKHKPRKFDLNSWVYLSAKNIKLDVKPKLAPKYLGPFQIIKIIGPQAYKLALPPLYSRIHPVFHVSLLEPARVRPGCMPESVEVPELAEEEGEKEWKIESIVDHRRCTGGIQYLVRWAGWSPEYDEWIHEGYMANAQEVVREYRKRIGDKAFTERTLSKGTKRKRSRR